MPLNRVFALIYLDIPSVSQEDAKTQMKHWLETHIGERSLSATDFGYKVQELKEKLNRTPTLETKINDLEVD